MDLSFSKEDLAFRDEVREFLATSLPADVKDRCDRGLHPTKEGQIRWQKILNEKGWMAPNWPKEYGGTGWTITQKYIASHECAPVWRQHGWPGDIYLRQSGTEG